MTSKVLVVCIGIERSDEAEAHETTALQLVLAQVACARDWNPLCWALLKDDVAII